MVPILLIGCKEIIPPGLVLTDPPVVLVDTFYDEPAPAPQHKVVLLEEFTGVTCLNCPPGHQTVVDILTDHPDSVIAVAIHNDNPLADPFPPPEEDFRTNEGIAISQLVGGSGAIPSGVIDRKDFANDGTPIEFRSSWPARVDQQVAEPTPVNVEVTITSFDSTTRELIAKVKLHYTVEVTADQNVSVMVTESAIISPQLQPDLSVDSNYVQDHVLRGMMTPAFGTAITVATPANRVIEKEFYMILGDTWNPDNCEVVAFVHERDGFMEVLQAGHVDVQ